MKLVEIIQTAVENASSDIHINVEYPIMYRIHGEMVVFKETITKKENISELLGELLNEEQKMQLDEVGEFDFAYSLQDFGRNRVNVYKQRGTYGIAIRLLSQRIPLPQELEIPESVVNLIHKKRGLVLFTGVAGSGKSTTIASLIYKIACTYTKNIITIENPIEYLYPYSKSMISQREVGYDTKSYEGALKAALRQDPDVIFVGELIDTDTIRMALHAAEAGNLVISTLHTSNAREAVDRIVDVFPGDEKDQVRVLLSNVIEGVVAQQFIQKENTKERAKAFEVMLATDEIKDIIRRGKTHHLNEAIQASQEVGMQTMDDAIFGLYIKSQLTAQTAVKYALDQSSMRHKVTI